MKIHAWIKNLQPLAFALFLAVGLFGYLLPAVGYFSSVPGDLGDARFNSVVLEHVYRWIMRREPSLWSPPFFYPFEHALAFSENYFGSAITYVLFRWLGFTREGAYDGWFFIGACLNYLTASFLLRRLGFSGLAAAAGAFVFAFSLPTLPNQDGHSQLLYRYAIPLAVLALFRALESGRLFHFWPAFFWVALQLYCSIYLGIFLGYLLFAMVLSLLLLKEGRRRLVQMISSVPGESALNKTVFVAAAVLSALAVGWLLYRYQMVSREYGLSRTAAEVARMLPRLDSYLLADHFRLSSWVGSRVGDLPMRWEHQLFPGIGVLFAVTCGVLAVWTVKQGGISGRVAFISFALLFVATFYVNGHSIYFLLLKIPGINAIRAVTRIILVMLLPMAILVAVATEKINSFAVFQNRVARMALAIGLALLLGAETVSYITYNEPVSAWRGRIAALKKLLPDRLPDRPILYVSMSRDDLVFPFLKELDGMILAQDMGIPTLNGYSGSRPSGYENEYAKSCSYLTRIYGYVDFRHRHEGIVADLARRVVQIGPTPCRASVIRSDHVITEAQAKAIRIRIDGVDYANKRFSVSIENHSPVVFNPLSTKGQVKLSWRFVPLNAAGVAVSDPGWDTRQELWLPIQPNGSETETIEISFPPPPKLYRLEVSLVQEEVAWFHDLGMPVGIAQINPVGR